VITGLNELNSCLSTMMRSAAERSHASMRPQGSSIRLSSRLFRTVAWHRLPISYWRVDADEVLFLSSRASRRCACMNTEMPVIFLGALEGERFASHLLTEGCFVAVLRAGPSGFAQEGDQRDADRAAAPSSMHDCASWAEARARVPPGLSKSKYRNCRSMIAKRNTATEVMEEK